MDTTIDTALQVTKSNASMPAIRKRPVLLVDDVPARFNILSRLLAQEGYLVLEAASCREALEIANAIKLDLILLNFKAPLEDECEAFGRLAEQDSLLPVVLITDSPDQFYHALTSGIRALLEMPLNFINISEKIRGLLGNRQKSVWHVSMSTF
jgi:CheY-like chemotaxis protein